jgi:hypothetical protein
MSTDVSSEQARATLRREHGVRLVSAAEEGMAADEIPAGVYGFTSSPALASPLFAARRYRNFEVHRLPAAAAVVGFVSPADAAKLTGRAEDVATIRLHPDAEGEASVIVCIPYDRIVQHRQYSIRNADAITLQVASAATHALTV